MSKIVVEGGNKLSGEIVINGAKNCAVALLPAAILTNEVVKIYNVPNISDITSLTEILNYLNVKTYYDNDALIIDASLLENKFIEEDLTSKLRASYYFMGSLLGKNKKVEIAFPGGCPIGERPINLHLKAFRQLGAKIIEEGNIFKISADKLKGDTIYFDFPSVGATINTMLAAVYAEGTTIIENAAKEPEIVNIATFLNQMGGNIKGAGTSSIIIKGVEKLNGCVAEVIPDRIEAGTYLMMGVLLGDNLKISNIIPEHIESLTSKLKEMNVPLIINSDNIIVSKCSDFKSVNVETLGYPGFPTDLQQPFTTVLTQARGVSTIRENIYENRFQNTIYLNQMGANIKIERNTIKISGKTKLYGRKVIASDLRAGASLLIAGLIAEGETIIENASHILRGYENITNKINNVGGKIRLVNNEEE